MTVNRATPNAGPVSGAAYAQDVLDEIAALWNAVHLVLDNVAGVDTITATTSPTLTGYAKNQRWTLIPVAANTGPVTLDIDENGSRALTDPFGNALSAGALQPGRATPIFDDGTKFRLDPPALSPAAEVYQGTWDADTNTPTIPAAAPANSGYFYIVNVAGTTTIDGISSWEVNDRIQSNGSVWQRIPNPSVAAFATDTEGRVGTSGILVMSPAVVRALDPENISIMRYITDPGQLTGAVNASPAFDDMFAELQTSAHAYDPPPGGVVWPQRFGRCTIKPAKYLIETSVNATGVRHMSNDIDARGAIFIGACVGKPMFDMLHTRFINWYGGRFSGLNTAKPSCAILHGRRAKQGAEAGAPVADSNTFTELAAGGYFTKGVLVNLAAEISVYENCHFVSAEPDVPALVFSVFSGGLFSITSDYLTPADGVGTLSFVGPTVRGGSFYQGSNNGPSIVLYSAATGLGPIRTVNFENIYYQAKSQNTGLAFIQPAIRVHGDIIDLRVVGTAEPYPEVKHLIEFDTSAGDVSVIGLYLRDAAMSAIHGAIGANTNANTVTIENADIAFRSVLADATARVIGSSAAWNVSGKIQVSNNAPLNDFVTIDNLRGTIHSARSVAGIVKPLAGNYTIYATDKTMHEGDHELNGTNL